MVSKAFERSKNKAIVVSLVVLSFESVYELTDISLDALLNGYCEIQIGIYKACLKI